MNLRLFSIALLISAHPLMSLASANNIKLNSGDFVSAEKITPEGETLVSVKLSKSGKAKFKKLNTEAVNQEVLAAIHDTSTGY